MTRISPCRHCSQLLPPPPMFTIGPPPHILSIDIRCSSRFLSPSSSTQHQKLTYSSSATLFLSVSLAIMIVLLIFTSAIVLIKNRLIKRRQERQQRYVQSSSVDRFNGHNHRHHHHNWTKLSDSCSSDQTSSTPPSEYPCAVIEPLLANDHPHEYEQIKYDSSLQNYCLIYCRQCANYHHTNLIQSTYQHQCTCHLRNDQHLYELQPMLRTTNDDSNSF
ncbi:unnamed protein product [Adineta ricciae]|uniref:Uncharacterized protein n=1 Tax=Adineta ricciae TaxID=249248 RepID=A0A814ED66_ADIRI|nr:unnamed protein product [Adineta ricciae]